VKLVTADAMFPCVFWTFAGAIKKKKELNFMARGACMFDENLVIFRAITKCCHFGAKTTRRRIDDGDVSTQQSRETTRHRIVGGNVMISAL